MRIQILSDIHLEFRSEKDKPLIRPDVDYIVFAGDIVTSPKCADKYFREVREETDAKLIYVLGNHEFYGQTHPDVIKEYTEICNAIDGLYLLDRARVFFKEHAVTFVGTTLWTSYRDGQDQYASESYMSDFRAIRTVDHEGRIKFIDSRDIRREHTKNKLFLENNLSRNWDETLIMVTHHAVSPQSTPTKYIASRTNGAFYEDLRRLISDRAPDLCIHGHTHYACNYQINQSLAICNPMGYLFERNNGFREALTLKADKETPIMIEEVL